MLRGSAWAARRDRAVASMEEYQQRLAELEEKRARRRAEFAARIPIMAAEVAAEVKAAVTAEVTAAVTAALDAAFERHQEAVREAVANALVLPRASSATTPASSPSDLHAPAQDASVTSERAMFIMTATATDPCSLTPSTCSTECPGGHIGALPAACPTTDATPPCVLPTRSSAVASMESKDTDGDAVQPVIFNSEYVDLAIVNVPPVFTKVPWQSVAFSDMKLTVASAVDGLLYTNLITNVTFQNGSSDNLEPVLRRIIKLISRSPHSKWPPMSLNGPFLSSADVHQEFMGIYSVTAVLSRLLPWPCFQFATGNTILLLPWDPGLPLCGIDTMFSTLVDGLAARVRSPSEVTCLQGNLIYELFGCSFVVELIKKGMVALEEQQPWISWECVSLFQPKPPWSHFAPTNSPTELMSDLRNVSESLYISGNSFELHMICFAAWYVFCARFRLKAYYLVQDSGCLTSHFIQRAYLLMQWKIPWLFSYPVVTIILWLQFATQNSFDPSCDQFVTEGTTYFGSGLIEWQIPCWDVTYTIASVPAIKHISGSESYLHGMGQQLESALLLEPHHQLSLEDLHPPWDVTKAQVACSLAQNYMRKIIVVLSITHSAMDMIIGWEFAWSSLFDILGVIQNTCELWPCILRSHTAVLIIIAFGNTTVEGPMEQWDPGIAWFFHMCIHHCLASCHLVCIAVTKVTAYITLLQHGFEFSATDHTLLVEGNEFKYFVITPRQVVWDLYLLQATGSVLADICPPLLAYLLQSFDTGNGCFGGSSYLSFEVLAIGNHKLVANVFDEVDMPSRVQAVQLPLKLDRSTEHSDTFSEYFLHLASILLLSKGLKLSWDPGGWKFFGFFTQAEAKGRRNVAAPTYYRSHYLDHESYFDIDRAIQDYYIDVFRDQVHLGYDYFLVRVVSYLNLVKVCLDYDTHRELSNVMKHQVPWDPGGSTWHRLEVKPNFKEGRMLATNHTVAWAGPHATGLGLHGRNRLQIHTGWLRTDWLGLGRLRPLASVFLLSPLLLVFFLCSSYFLFFFSSVIPRNL